MTYNRRQILQGLAAGAASVAAGDHTVRAQAAAVSGAQGKALEAREALWETGVAASNPQPVWAYNGDIPGSVLRIRQGDLLDVQLFNRLAQDTTIHWRGVRGPNAMDGVGGLTQAPVKPGERFSYRFVPPDSGTFIYHAHPEQNRAAQVHRGLSGVLVVEEKNPPEVDEEIVFALADWRIASDGKSAEASEERTLDLADARGPGRFGSLLTINGKAVPLARLARPGARLRFRIANLCPARIVALTFHGAQPTIASIDGQACGAICPGGPHHSGGPRIAVRRVCRHASQGRGSSARRIAELASGWTEGRTGTGDFHHPGSRTIRREARATHWPAGKPCAAKSYSSTIGQADRTGACEKHCFSDRRCPGMDDQRQSPSGPAGRAAVFGKAWNAGYLRFP